MTKQMSVLWDNTTSSFIAQMEDGSILRSPDGDSWSCLDMTAQILRQSVRKIRLANAQRRSALFNDTFESVGSILATMRGHSIASAHPHRCKCQDASGEKDPHKHYPEPPFSCARCSACDAYTPSLPEEEATT